MQTDIVPQVMRRLAVGAAALSGSRCSSSADQLAAPPRSAACAPLYTVWGDEPLLAQEAGDAIRAAARAAGCSERQVHTVAGAHFDWSALLGASQALSLFADRQLIEIRIPSGKPGKDGSRGAAALLRARCAATATSSRWCSCRGSTATQQSSAWFAALDGAGVTRARRSGRAQRAAAVDRAAPRRAGPARRARATTGQRALAFFADRVEGNLLAAHQEMQKLALLYPAGRAERSSRSRPRCSTSRATTCSSSARRCSPARWRARCACSTGCSAEGEAAVLVHWTLAEDIRGLKRVKDALAAGKPLPLALREARVWGAKERLFERARAAARASRALAASARRGARLRRPGQGPEAPRLAARSVGRR